MERRQASAQTASYSTAWSLKSDCDKDDKDKDFLHPSEPGPCTTLCAHYNNVQYSRVEYSKFHQRTV